MRIGMFVGLASLVSVGMLSVGCASGTAASARKSASPTVDAVAMILPQPKLLDVGVAASAAGKYEEADVAFSFAANGVDEPLIDLAEGWIEHMHRRLPLITDAEGLEDLAVATDIGNRFAVRVAQDPTIAHDIRVATMVRIASVLLSARDCADALAQTAVIEARALADSGDTFWTPNDREKIHEALVILAPFSVHQLLLSARVTGQVMGAKAYILSYVSESEHRPMLMNAGHIAK